MMLSSAWLGAHHSICFEELSEYAIKTRIELFKPDIILCRKKSKLKVFNSIKESSFSNTPIHIINLEQSKDNETFEKKLLLEPQNYSKNSSLFTLYTSGSTGKPKAITHSAKNYFEYTKFTTDYFFGIKKGSKMFTCTDAGWINGHSYALYGPLACEGQTIICEDLTKLSNPKNLIKYITSLEVTCLYMSVTLIRVLKSNCKESNTIKWDMINTLDRIGSCGEPLADEIGRWAINFFRPSRQAIVNTFFQTETGGILVAPRDEDNIPNDYSCVGKPREELGLFIAKNRLNNLELESEKIDPNEILIEKYWKGLFQKVVSDRPVNYFTKRGYFRLNDVGFFDENGYLYIGGRSDDVINTAGHRISTSEIESIALSIPFIKEACVVAKKDNILGEKPILFITLSENQIKNFEEITKNIQMLIKSKLSEYHQPEEVFVFQNLPKTRSGKIMRRIMKELAGSIAIDQKKDYSTLSNLIEFKKSYENFFREKVDSISQKGFKFSVNNFNKRNGLENGSPQSLYIFLILILEKTLRVANFKSLEEIIIKIENNISEIISCEYKSNNNHFDLKNFYKYISSSDLKKESCMLDINRCLISIRNKNDCNFIVIFKFISNDIFRINIENLSIDSEKYLKIKNIINELLQTKEEQNNIVTIEKNLPNPINSLQKVIFQIKF